MILRLLGNTIGLMGRSERGPTALQYYWRWIRAGIFVWVLSQCLWNTARFVTVFGNLRSVSQDVNHLGREGFARSFASFVSRGDIDIEPEDVEITLDEVAEQFSISVPFTWKFDFLLWEVEIEDTLSTITAQLPAARWR